MQEYFNLDIRKLLLSVGKGTVIEEKHLVTIFYNSLCALNFIHSANIIHRDLKPSNMLIDCNCQIKICDFGLARSLNNYQNSSYS
ncbi:MAG: protein kinase domain-containing protein [bacterium]